MRSIPAGTPPEELAGARAPGRFAIVSGKEGWYAFLPELYNLFSLPRALAEELSPFTNDSFSSNLPGLKPGEQSVRDFFTTFIKEQQHVAPIVDSPDDVGAGLKDLVLNVSQLCNLNCSYCYADELNRQRATMTSATAEAVVSKAFSLSTTGLHSVKFLGGEPTLAFDTIEYTVDLVKRKSSDHGWPPPTFVIVTNGTAVTDRMAEFFKLHGFYVLVSLDGTPDIHNKLRPYIGGRPSYDKVSKTLAKLIENGIDLAVESVYTQKHYDAGCSVTDLVSHLLGLGVREMQITLALGSWHGDDNHSQIEAVCTNFAEAARMSVRSFKTDDPFLLRGIGFVLDGFVKRERRGHVCGAGRTFMAANYDGEAFPCYLLESLETSYGVIGKTWNEEKYAKVSSRFYKNGKTYHDVCRNCWANEICQSCLGSTFLIDKELAKPPAWFCATQKTMIAAVLGEIGTALSDGNRETFLASVTRFVQARRAG